MAARHKNRAAGGSIEKKYGDDSSILKEAKAKFKPADSDDAAKIHGGTVRSRFVRPGRKRGGAALSSAGKDMDCAYADGGGVKGFHPGGEKGKLHREMGVPEGDKIPAKKLAAAAHSDNPEKRRDAIRAETMKKWKH